MAQSHSLVVSTKCRKRELFKDRRSYFHVKLKIKETKTRYKIKIEKDVDSNDKKEWI